MASLDAADGAVVFAESVTVVVTALETLHKEVKSFGLKA